MTDYRSNFGNLSGVSDSSLSPVFVHESVQFIQDNTTFYKMSFSGIQKVVDETPLYRMYYANLQLIEEFIPSPWYDADTEGSDMSTELFPELIGLQFDIKRKPMFNTEVQNHVSGRETRFGFWDAPKWQFEMSYDYLPNYPKSVGNTDLETILGFFLRRRGKFQTFLYRFQDDYMVENGLLGTGDGAQAEFTFTRKIGGYEAPVDYVDVTTNPPIIWWELVSAFTIATEQAQAKPNIVKINSVKIGATTLTKVTGAPGANEYNVDETTGLFTFNASRNGQTVNIDYKWKLTISTDYTFLIPNAVSFSALPPVGTKITATFHFYYNVRFMEDESDYNLFADKLYELQELVLQSVPV